VSSIAASEVESLVLGQVRRLLASPQLVAPTITAVRRENDTARDAVVEESEVIDALGALEPVWDELYPAEQSRILRLLIERIPEGMSVTLTCCPDSKPRRGRTSLGTDQLERRR
jgi:hypothetical protein